MSFVDHLPMLRPVLIDVEQSAVGAAVRLTPQLYPVLESLHLVGIALLVGPALVMDLRLMGLGGRTVPVGTVLRLVPVCMAGFALAAVTGLAMFAGIALSVGESMAAPWKFGLILLAGVNALLFHVGVRRSLAAWQVATRPPLAARLAGAVSAASWCAVVVAGRYLAYV